MPKVPLPTKIPESISPTLWQNVNRRDILSFLSDHGGTYLFYSVMKNDPDPDNSTIEYVNAAKVDKIRSSTCKKRSFSHKQSPCTC